MSESENEINQMYTSTLDIANYYDSIRDIEKTLKYSFMLCEENSNETSIVGIIKIVYWCSQMGKYDKILELFELIKGKDIQIDKFKESFLRENKISFKNYLLKTYIKIIITKEQLFEQNKIIDNKKSSEYMIFLYKLMYEIDLYAIYDEIKNEKNNVTDFVNKYKN